MIDESISIDIHGNQTRSYTQLVTLDTGPKLVKTIVDVPDSQYDQVSVSRNGLLQYTTSTSNLKTTYKYDALGRRTEVKEQRHDNPTVTAYDPTTGQVTSVTDPAGNVTTYAYYENTGRLKSVTRTVDSQPIVQYFAYDAQGRQTHVWGNGTYPVAYEYDDYGRRTKMHSSIATAWEKLNREAELRLAHFGRKGKANCAKRVCFYQRIDFELEEHFEVNGARISAYNACAIYWNKAGSTWTASCKVRRIIWDGWHWNGIGKDYNWYVDTGERKYEWTGSPD